MPDFLAGRFVEAIEPFGGFFVKKTEHWAESPGIGFGEGRTSDEVVVIGKDGPSLQFPAEIAGDCQQAALEHLEALAPAKEMLLIECASGDKIDAVALKPVLRRMRPWNSAGGLWGCIGF
jgi:hypothetical protein